MTLGVVLQKLVPTITMLALRPQMGTVGSGNECHEGWQWQWDEDLAADAYLGLPWAPNTGVRVCMATVWLQLCSQVGLWKVFAGEVTENEAVNQFLKTVHDVDCR